MFDDGTGVCAVQQRRYLRGNYGPTSMHGCQCAQTYKQATQKPCKWFLDTIVRKLDHEDRISAAQLRRWGGVTTNQFGYRYANMPKPTNKLSENLAYDP